MTELLTPQEIAKLTGFVWSRHQSQWLVEMGIPHRLDGKRILVSDDHVMRWLEGQDVSKESPPKPVHWSDYILQPDAHRYDAQVNDGPNVIGIYGLYSPDGELLYIGKANGVPHRINAHYWASQRGDQALFLWYSCLEVPLEILKGVEAAHIAALYPPRNFKLETSPCDFRDEMVKAIKQVWKVIDHE